MVVRSGPSKSNKSLTIFVDVLNFEKNETGSLVLVPVKDRITIQRKDIEVCIILVFYQLTTLQNLIQTSLSLAY